MGYCTETDITNTIAQALTSATSQNLDNLNNLGNLVNVGRVLDNNLVTSSIISYYIQLADQEIDGGLSQLYKTPFCETVDFETNLFSAIDEYNNILVLERPCPLSVSDIILLRFVDTEERHEIETIITPSTFETVDMIQYFFPADSRILRVVYPSPIRFISARLAAANIYDKYFSAESSPNISSFGDKLRELANEKINDILNGSIILHGQQRIGRRFYNPNLVEQYSLPTGGKMSKDYRQVKGK